MLRVGLILILCLGIFGKVFNLPTSTSTIKANDNSLSGFNGSEDTEEEQEMFDQILEANSAFDTELIEGDIKEDNNDNDEYGRHARSAVRNKMKLWPGGIIPYKLSLGLDYSVKRFIHDAMKQLQCETCIQFRLKKSTDKNYLYFYNGDGCWSWVGRHFGKQKISLSSRGCKSKGIAMHEMIHAMGFWHEQARPDRDDYIRIDMKNVKSSARSNFKKRSNTEAQFFTEYDLDSIMHYSAKAFSKNGRKTIIPWKNVTHRYKFRLGQREHLTKRDIEGINILYHCKVTGCGKDVLLPNSKSFPSNVTDKLKHEKKSVNKLPVMKIGTWMPWDDWTLCDQYCTQRRSRKCNQTEPILCGRYQSLAVQRQSQHCSEGVYCQRNSRSEWDRYG